MAYRGQGGDALGEAAEVGGEGESFVAEGGAGVEGEGGFLHEAVEGFFGVVGGEAAGAAGGGEDGAFGEVAGCCGGPTHDDGTVMNGAPSGWRCWGDDGTVMNGGASGWRCWGDDGTVMNGAPNGRGGAGVQGGPEI